MTYKQIQNYTKEHYGFSPKTCWIADIKEQCGLMPKLAPNRKNPKIRTNPCPKNKIEVLKLVFKDLGII